jgi:hypothetical protein
MNSNAIVGRVVAIEPPLSSFASKELSDGPAEGMVVRLEKESAWLRPNHPQAKALAGLLEELRQADAPAYLLAHRDPASSERSINKLHLPISTKVIRLAESGFGEILVDFKESNIRHTLDPEHPSFDDIAATLRYAYKERKSVLVIKTDPDHQIIDVIQQDSPSGEDIESCSNDALSLPPVSLQEAEDMFSLVSKKTCHPKIPLSPCIPFLYPDDGCWVRAHEMCRVIFEKGGVRSQKMWAFGDSLQAQTHNHPYCRTPVWYFHVAPVLDVFTSDVTSETIVIDPALFERPVDLATWAAALGDPHLSLLRSTSDIYRLEENCLSERDDDFSQTRLRLEDFRRRLFLRSIGNFGRPPYPYCRLGDLV